MPLTRFFVPMLAATTMVARTAFACAIPHEAGKPHHYSEPYADSSEPHAESPAFASSKNMKLLANVAKTNTAGEGPDFQSDLAFWGDLAVAGNYDGFKIIDISKPDSPRVLANVSCRGPQNDVSVWEDLLILSVDQPRTSGNCDSELAVPAHDPTAWEGIRIFSIKEILATPADQDGFIRNINPIAAVATDCGSHTHTTIPDLKNDRLLVYISSYPLLSGPRCGPENAQAFGYDPLHRKISIVEIPFRKPERAKVLSTPRIDVPVWNIKDLGVQGAFNPMIGCHDIQVFTELGLAAAACASVGQVWDISDLERPKTLKPLWTVDEPAVHFYHSAAFTWDGKITVFSDEVVVGTSCQAPTDQIGRMWFYNTKSGKERGSFLIPRVQGADTPGGTPQYCTAHLYNFLMTEKGYILASSWYRGGTSLIDLTDPENAKEIAFFDPGPKPQPAPELDFGAWSSYWYNGFIYSNNFNRGVDIFGVRAKGLRDVEEVDFENPQTQLELERRRHRHHHDHHDDDERGRDK
jgi:hypothetical protein